MENNSVEQQEQFFATGLEKYMDAKSAVELFEKEAQRRVKEMVLGAAHRVDIAKLFGEDWKDYLFEMPDRAWVGQKAVFKGFGGLYFALFFSRDQDKRDAICLVPAATFWREKTTLWEPLWSKASSFLTQYPALSVEKWSISLTGIQPNPLDWDSCKNALDTVIVDWIELWQKLDFVPKDAAT